MGRDHGTRWARENPQDQFALMRIAVEERGRRASSEWRDDACSRRLGILNGVPETVGERQRANINFYMLRDVRIQNARELTSGDVTDEFARVSEATRHRQDAARLSPCILAPSLEAFV